MEELSEARKRNMRAIKARDTKPELLIRQGLHSRGFRYRIAPKALPGKPDIWLPKYNTAIFINGCFWHLHRCHLSHIPNTRKQFWNDKLTGNAARDKRNISALLKDGKRVLVVWECALKGKERLPEPSIFMLISTWIKSGAVFGELSGKGLEALNERAQALWKLKAD
ncbi:DNA mismatch endonuclease Vsr [Grimontia sp. S25]|uniref:DNA mismatch endonuclease Vsr n=1 Tax=Grimontia sedimenti TaxID=2711294 RepID=A0A6M1RHE8_9GAMM|nr:very short patch repair endonuclease [Grimontia sedimenti]NGN97691.1 DNA mismatch endonuclease Vsr [Grimontia sedimenti]